MKLTAALTGDKAVRAELQRSGGLAGKALAATALRVEDYIEAEASKHTTTGAILQSIFKKALPGGGWEIGHDLQRAPQALWVHCGTRAHVIRPKNKKALRWAGGGALTFAKGVHHPGYKGDAWMVRAAVQAPRIFEAQVAAMIAKTGTGTGT